jgi:uncharacterized iron-regulated protein
MIVMVATPCSSFGEEGKKSQRSQWIDLCRAEPARFRDVLDDLATARVIYIGEQHRLERHHEIQEKIISRLGSKGLALVIALEQMETSRQPALDQFNRGEIGFDELAKATAWAERWSNFGQYRPVLEAARKAGAPVIALNAETETIRQVVRSGGVERLPPPLREKLPREMQLTDQSYAKLLSLQLMVHAAATPERLSPMIEAQIARDEAMAAALSAYLNSESGRGRTAVVLCGAGHVAYGMGTPERVRRNIPGLRDRIVLVSESGETELTEQEKAAARPIEITHEQLREIQRPIADYLYATSLRRRGGQTAENKDVQQ